MSRSRRGRKPAGHEYAARRAGNTHFNNAPSVKNRSKAANTKTSTNRAERRAAKAEADDRLRNQ